MYSEGKHREQHGHSSTEDDALADARLATAEAVEFQSSEGGTARQVEASERARQMSSLHEQDEIATPVPFPQKPLGSYAGDRPVRASGSSRVVLGLCFIISLLSLAISGFLLFSLLSVRQTMVEGLDAAIQFVDDLDGEGFQYEYRFERTVPVSANIPIQQDVVFPFQGNIPINTRVKVPIDAGILGTFELEIPINTSVYVNTSVPVNVDQTFQVSTTIPVSMTIPIDIRPDDPDIQDLLSRVRRWLVRLRQEF